MLPSKAPIAIFVQQSTYKRDSGFLQAFGETDLLITLVFIRKGCLLSGNIYTDGK